jgi:hypothetical protein
MTTPAFTAKYSGGRCAASCGEPIIEGETLTYVDDQLVHIDCATSHVLRERVQPTICPDCFLTLPCDCEPPE